MSECPTCEVLREQVAWLRGQLESLTLRVQSAAAPTAAPLAPVSLAPLPPEELLRQAGIFADPATGLAMVMYDGKMIPWTEWNRGQRALDQAIAGNPIETEGT